MFFINSPTKFPLGQLVVTSHVLSKVPKSEIEAALNHHAQGDWGIMPEEDQKANNRALNSGERIFSAYRSSKDVKFWIITEWDRSTTTVLLPEDY